MISLAACWSLKRALGLPWRRAGALGLLLYLYGRCGLLGACSVLALQPDPAPAVRLAPNGCANVPLFSPRPLRMCSRAYLVLNPRAAVYRAVVTLQVHPYGHVPPMDAPPRIPGPAGSVGLCAAWRDAPIVRNHASCRLLPSQGALGSALYGLTQVPLFPQLVGGPVLPVSRGFPGLCSFESVPGPCSFGKASLAFGQVSV